MRNNRKLCVLALSLGLIYPMMNNVGAAPKARDYWPTKAWKSTNPEKQGMSAERLKQLQAFLERDGTTKGVMIVRHGYVVAEWYFRDFKASDKHRSASVAKSFTSAIVGRAIADGKIKGPKQKVSELHPLGAQFKDLTIENLLTMSSGFQWRNKKDKIEIFLADSYEDFLKSKKIVHKPGTKFQYKPADPMFLSVIVQHKTGKTLKDFGVETLLKPIGINEFSWGTDPKGTTNGAAGINMRVRDFARFGYLYLNRGHWDGQQLLPKRWVDRSTTFKTPTRKTYAYLWWTKHYKGPVPADTYAAIGKGGQRIAVIPSLDIVAVRVGDEFKQKKATWDYQFLKHITEAVKPVIPAKKTPVKKALYSKPIK
jgi:CubicO group peptidase (beta-lactamase class C family)